MEKNPFSTSRNVFVQFPVYHLYHRPYNYDGVTVLCMLVQCMQNEV